MNYTQFKEAVQKEIYNFLPERFQNYAVDIQPALKNNGVVMDRLVIQGNKLANPSFYLDEYFRYYEEGKPLESILKEMADFYEQNYDGTLEFGIKVLRYERAKEHLMVVVCNAEMNEALLKNVPYERVEDLALVYHIKRTLPNGEIQSTLVDNRRMNAWKIDEQTLKKDAWKSMETEGVPCLRSMREIFAGQIFADELPVHLYVLTNQEEILGAAYMFDADIMAEIAKLLESSLIVLPSSVHETIIIAEEWALDVEEMKTMVRTINSTELEQEDILSNQVYRYDKDTQELSIAVSQEQEQGMNMSL